MSKVINLQASVFGDFRRFEMNHSSVIELYKVLMEKGFMPEPMKEVDLQSQELRNRPYLVEQKENYSILIGTERINITSHEAVSRNMPTKDAFITKSGNIFELIFSTLQIKANRLSFLYETHREPVGEINTISEGEKYLVLDWIHNKEKIFEWAANIVSEETIVLEGLNEKTNINISVSKRDLIRTENGVPVTNNNKPEIKQVLSLAQDINTKLELQDNRFESCHIKKFLEAVENISNDIEEMVLSR